MPWPAPGRPSNALTVRDPGAACEEEDPAGDGRHPCPRPPPRQTRSFLAPALGSGPANPTAAPGRQQLPDVPETDAWEASWTYFLGLGRFLLDAIISGVTTAYHFSGKVFLNHRAISSRISGKLLMPGPLIDKALEVAFLALQAIDARQLLF